MCIRDRLAAYLSAVLQGYTRASAQAELERIFAAQYQLTLTEEVEVRYRTETRTDSEGNEYDVEVPYNYYILNVTLTDVYKRQVQDRQPVQSRIQRTLTRREGIYQWLMYPYPKT